MVSNIILRSMAKIAIKNENIVSHSGIFLLRFWEYRKYTAMRFWLNWWGKSYWKSGILQTRCVLTAMWRTERKGCGIEVYYKLLREQTLQKEVYFFCEEKLYLRVSIPYRPSIRWWDCVKAVALYCWKKLLFWLRKSWIDSSTKRFFFLRRLFPNSISNITQCSRLLVR